jgi:hypothetical protein
MKVERLIPSPFALFPFLNKLRTESLPELTVVR